MCHEKHFSPTRPSGNYFFSEFSEAKMELVIRILRAILFKDFKRLFFLEFGRLNSLNCLKIDGDED